jgi:hypothetical protein
MSFASKPGAPRLVGTKTACAVPNGLPRVSLNGVEFPGPVVLARVRAAQAAEQTKPAPEKTKK